ncbi:hypothetical protein EON63_21675 [archaeon]|nr:MAG: hypothetical protein EON63_21675 [archaeon]
MVSTEFGSPASFIKGFNPAEATSHYGHTVHVWNFKEKVGWNVCVISIHHTPYTIYQTDAASLYRPGHRWLDSPGGSFCS